MKTLFALMAALFLFCTAGFSQTFQQGDFSGDVNSEGWSLSKGTGARNHIIFVSFNKAFDSPPNIVLSLTGYEMKPGTDSAVRISLKAEKVTKSGFIVKIYTWGDSEINSASGTWLAYTAK